MFLNNVTKKIIIFSFFNVAFCAALDHPFVVRREDGVVATYKNRQALGLNMAAPYSVCVRDNGSLLHRRFYVSPVEKMIFQYDGYLQVQLSDGRRDWILIGW